MYPLGAYGSRAKPADGTGGRRPLFFFSRLVFVGKSNPTPAVRLLGAYGSKAKPADGTGGRRPLSLLYYAFAFPAPVATETALSALYAGHRLG